MASENLLEIRSLTVAYGSSSIIIKDINLSVGKREIVSIVGESGSGKTTLIRAIINLLPNKGQIMSGDIIFNGNSLKSVKENKWLDIRGNEICMIFQNAGSFLNPIKKIEDQFIENIRSHRKISKSDARDKAAKTLKKMNFGDCRRIMNSYSFQLSGGMKQRVAIAMALAMEPKLILADEPTSALDVVTQKQIIEELMEIRKLFDTSIIMVTHNMGCAAYIADRIIVMNDGEIVESGNVENLIENPQQAYTRQLLRSIPELKGYQ